mgnify:CR=1 FL=1
MGDDANWNAKVADYWVANLHGSYQLTKELQIYGFINNLFNRKFATYGTFFDPQSTVAVAMASADGYPDGQPRAGILKGDSLIFAIKILDSSS